MRSPMWAVRCIVRGHTVAMLVVRCVQRRCKVRGTVAVVKWRWRKLPAEAANEDQFLLRLEWRTIVGMLLHGVVHHRHLLLVLQQCTAPFNKKKRQLYGWLDEAGLVPRPAVSWDGGIENIFGRLDGER